MKMSMKKVMKSSKPSSAALSKVLKITKPKSKKEHVSLAKKVQRGVNISLYSGNKQPKMSVQGTGFGSSQRAKDTLKICSRDCRDLTHQKQVVLTMFNRAKFHPNQSQGMRDAMKVFKPWMENHGMKAPM